MGAENVTKHCATLGMAGVWEMGELGFPIARVCCGWIFLMPFPSPLAPRSCNSLLKETSLSCAELSTGAICKDATRRSSTSQFTGWTAVGNGHSLRCQIAYAPKGLPVEQTRVVSLFPPPAYMRGGELFRQSPFWGRDCALCFFVSI